MKLTRSEIDALEEGYALDCLVAEYVLGRPKPTTRHRDHIDMIDFGAWYCLPDYFSGDVCEYTPHAFSSNMAYAWLVVAQFDRYTIYSAMDNLHYCELGADLVGAYGTTPALAICRAGLMAVMNGH